MKIALGLLTTMAALLLSLQLSSAKTTFDMQEEQVNQVSSQLLLLDQALADAGRGSRSARDTLRNVTLGFIVHSWPDRRSWTRPETPPGGEALFGQISAISSVTEEQRMAKGYAVSQALALAQLLRTISTERGSSTDLPLLAVEISWIAIIFVGFGLIAPRNGTALTALLLCGLAVAGAIFLIVEMSTPFSGYITISDGSLESALLRIGR